jgi:hypothetical protein
MKSFGVWLHDSHLTLSEVVALRAVATTLAQNWPIASSQRGDYETSISTHLPAPAQSGALQQLGAVWSVYELDNLEVDQHHTGRILGNLFGLTPQQSNSVAVLGVGIIIILMFYTILNKISLI